MDPSADWSNTTKLYEKIASITGGEADFVPVWTSRLLDYYPHNQGYVVARFEYPRFQPRYKGGILVVDSKGHPAKQKSFPSVSLLSLPCLFPLCSSHRQSISFVLIQIDLAPISIMSRTATPQIVFELKPLKDIKTTSAREAADKQMRDRSVTSRSNVRTVLAIDASLSLREIFRLYHLPIWRELKKEGGEETTPSAQFDTPYVPNLDGPIESDEVDDSDRIDEPKLSVEKPLKTLYGISAFGNNFAVYRLKIDSKFNPELFDKNSLILPQPGQQSNNTYATLQNRCPESWWAYDATTIEGKQVLDDVIALSQEAFLALTLRMFIPFMYAKSLC